MSRDEIKLTKEALDDEIHQLLNELQKLEIKKAHLQSICQHPEERLVSLGTLVRCCPDCGYEKW